MRLERRRSRRPALDPESLDKLALSYVTRYATTRARLANYLERKVEQRGWSAAEEPPIAVLVERLASLGYVDDRAFAAARAAVLGRRGYGPHRIGAALRGAGIGEEDALEARQEAQSSAWAAAVRLAERRGIGPFASVEADRQGRERAVGILVRAGHSLDVARRLACARPGEIPDEDGS